VLSRSILFTDTGFTFQVLLQSNLLKSKTSLPRRDFEVNGPAEGLDLLTTPSAKQLAKFSELLSTFGPRARFSMCSFPLFWLSLLALDF